jgi:hypothetical protein
MMLKDIDFFDDKWHMAPFGENGVLFTAYYACMMRLRLRPDQWEAFKAANRIKVIQAISETLLDTNDYLSHDNMTGIVCLSELFNLAYHKKLFHKHWWRRLHPRDIGFYLFAKTKIKLFLAPTFLAMFYACWHKQESMGNLDTDGKLLSWLRINTYDMTLMDQTCREILYTRHNLDWDDIFDIYFLDETHPLRRHSKAVYEA